VRNKRRDTKSVKKTGSKKTTKNLGCNHNQPAVKVVVDPAPDHRFLRPRRTAQYPPCLEHELLIFDSSRSPASHPIDPTLHLATNDCRCSRRPQGCASICLTAAPPLAACISAGPFRQVTSDLRSSPRLGVRTTGSSPSHSHSHPVSAFGTSRQRLAPISRIITTFATHLMLLWAPWPSSAWSTDRRTTQTRTC